MKTKSIENWEFYKGTLGGIWEVWRQNHNDNHYNVPWENIRIPHTANAFDVVDPDKYYYQGNHWYRCQLEIEKNPYKNGRTTLHFEGAGQRSKVYLFKTLVGEHVGGYDEFSVDITDAIKEVQKDSDFESYEGRFPIAVVCDNSRDLNLIPSDTNDFHLQGGLYRKVHLSYKPAAYIDSIKSYTEFNETKTAAELTVELDFINNSKEDIKYEIKLLDPSDKVVVSDKAFLKSGESRVSWKSLVKNPELWSTEKPSLYKLEIIDLENNFDVQRKIGFRYFEFVKQGPFKLNGKRLLLNGTHRHEDHASVGAALSDELVDEEFRLMKEMGVNFIRLGHYQQSEYTLNKCDELGILVWEEIPWSRGGLGGEVYQKQAKDMLQNMIRQHHTHPSVIIWGTGNENDWKADFDYFEESEIKDFMTELHELSHKEDPSRKTAIRRCDFCKDVIDVYSPSIWAGWYRGLYTEYEQSIIDEMKKVDSVLHVEWGADNHLGRHTPNPYNGFDEIETGYGTDERDGDFFNEKDTGTKRVSALGDWSESYFCELVDWHLYSQQKMDYFVGSAFWPFKDFATPVRPDNAIPFVNEKGVLARDMQIKEGYYVFQSYWTEDKMLRIYGHDWDVRWAPKGQKHKIHIYSNCDEIQVIIDKHETVQLKRDNDKFPCRGFYHEVELDEGDHTIEAIEITDKANALKDAVSFKVVQPEWGKAQKVQHTIKKLDKDITQIDIRALDGSDRIVADASEFVFFDYIGDGEMIDNLGAYGGARKIQFASGKASIKIKNNNKGILSVKIDGENQQLIEL